MSIIPKTVEHAAIITYGSSTTTLMLWGFHFSDLAIGISAFASLIGVGLQIYVALTKVRLMRRSQRWSVERRHGGTRRDE